MFKKQKYTAIIKQVNMAAALNQHRYSSSALLELYNPMCLFTVFDDLYIQQLSILNIQQLQLFKNMSSVQHTWLTGLK